MMRVITFIMIIMIINMIFMIKIIIKITIVNILARTERPWILIDYGGFLRQKQSIIVL